MKIKVKDYQRPKEVTYTTTEVFFVVDEESKVGLRVIGSEAEFVGWNGRSGQYDREGFNMQRYMGVKIEVIQGLVAAYENRIS